MHSVQTRFDRYQRFDIIHPGRAQNDHICHFERPIKSALKFYTAMSLIKLFSEERIRAMPPFPDETYPVFELSLQQFNTLAFSMHQDTAAFVEFVLAGRCKVFDQYRRVVLRPDKEWYTSTAMPITLTRDYDSLFGFTRTLPFQKEIHVYAVPSFNDTLTKDNHMRKEVKVMIGVRNENLLFCSCCSDAFQGEWKRKTIDLCKIPNTALARLGHRSKTLIFFPRLYSDTPPRKAVLTQAQLTLLYNACVRRAIEAVSPEAVCHWPVDYERAYTQAKDKTSKLRPGTIDISPDLLPNFCTQLLECLDSATLPDSDAHIFRGAFFYHEFRGLKGATQHPTNRAAEAFEFLTRDFWKDMPTEEWWIDVGIEVYSPGKVLQWLNSSHEALLRFALPEASAQAEQDARWDEMLTRAVQGSNMKEDTSAQIYELQGFRLMTRQVGALDETIYVNVYTTDKTNTYQLHQGMYRRHWPSDLLPESMPNTLKDIVSIGNVFSACSGQNPEHIIQPGSARIEVRTALDRAFETLPTLSEEILENSVVGFNAIDWW